MSTIDWSKAPDWASAHGKVFCITSRDIWFNESVYMYVGDTRSYPWSSRETEVMYNHSRQSVTDIVSRPIPWTGEGLPPVGTVCEYLGAHQYNEWSEVKIFGAWRNFVFVDFTDGWRQEDNPKRFRPIRTAEQIAADERLHAIRNALSTINSKIEQYNIDIDCSAAMRATVEAMIDAGYIRQVQP